MKVPFYGHIKQYHAIKAEIDSNIRRVLESGQYVMGPMLERGHGFRFYLHHIARRVLSSVNAAASTWTEENMSQFVERVLEGFAAIGLTLTDRHMSAAVHFLLLIGW